MEIREVPTKTFKAELEEISPSGRVVRLHFTCRAELPVGAQLRVTGSTLWGPAPTTGTGPTNAGTSTSTAASITGESAIDESEDVAEILSSNNLYNNYYANLYTSSVELVTTPEMYPTWKTRRPVIVVLHKHVTQIQHHYYRYLVVTPGAAMSYDDDDDVSNAGTDDATNSSDNAPGATTTNEAGDESVVSWENPFASMTRSPSSLSITSSRSIPNQTKSWTYLANLPYRTLDINVETARCMDDLYEDGDNMDDGSAVRIDEWNNPDDRTFRPYQIRESMHQERQTIMQQYQTFGPSNLKPITSTHLKKHLSELSTMSDEIVPKDEELEDEHSTEDDSEMHQHEFIQGRVITRSSSALPEGRPTPQQILFVCYHLPVVVIKSKETGNWKASWSESLMAQKEGSKIVATMLTHWVGTVTPRPPLKAGPEGDDDRAAIYALLADMNCTPIFLAPEIRQAHYYGFCKQVLWPAFHNIDLLDLSTSGLVSMADGGENATNSDWDQSRLSDWWTAYQSVNQTFAEVVYPMLTPDSYLWIHDYHLSLLPRYVQALEAPNRLCRKVFFLHIPFPTSQIFRELECGEAILEGMLHADVIGFHAFDHARHFLNAAKRILGLNYESLVGGLIGVQFHGKTVLISMSNVSLEPNMADAALALPSVEKNRQMLKAKHGDRKIIGGVDIGQRLSGTSLKLLAYERLLQDYPSWQSRVVMVQRVLIPSTRKADEDMTTRELRVLVKRLQDKFGPEVIDYEELSGSSMPLDKRMGLWKASDVFMSTPIREGLNQWPMEYIYSKDKENPGVVIASEFSAVCSILNGALRVNPFDIQMTITVIDKALTMDLKEREGRRYRDMDFVSNSPSDKWVRNVLRDLNDVARRNAASDSSAATPLSGTPTTPRMSQRDQLQGTAAFLVKEANTAFTHLNLPSLKAAYDRSSRRVIILDFNGTIVLKEPPGKYLKREILGTSGNKPPPQVLESLATLCADKRNTVYVVSGDSSENVLSALGKIPNLGLAVSNGAKFSAPVEDVKSERHWKTFDLGVDWDAVKRCALPVLSKYTARSNGSFVKLTTLSIGWSYYCCDPEWGSLQAVHLVMELKTELKAFDVRFVTLKGIVEVVPRKLNKGLIVKKVLRDTSKQHKDEGLDFIMCLGDDISDEKMFTSVFSFIAEMGNGASATPGPPVINQDGTVEESTSSATAADDDDTHIPVVDPMYAYTVAVGKKPSHASMWVTDAQEVASALVLLAQGDLPPNDSPVWGRENATHLFT